MPLDRRFVRATITELAPTTFKLEITYSWYNLYEYTTTFVFPTLNDCICRLCVERCSAGVLRVTALDGTLTEIDPQGG